MQVNPYLVFDGRCEAAFKVYAQILGGKIEAMMAHEGTPAAEHVPAQWRSKIMHARLAVCGMVLMGCDTPPDRYEEPKGFSVTLGLTEPAEAERIAFRHAHRPLRDPVDDQLRAARLTFASATHMHCERSWPKSVADLN
jgi:PhnB protein